MRDEVGGFRRKTGGAGRREGFGARRPTDGPEPFVPFPCSPACFRLRSAMRRSLRAAVVAASLVSILVMRDRAGLRRRFRQAGHRVIRSPVGDLAPRKQLPDCPLIPYACNNSPPWLQKRY